MRPLKLSRKFLVVLISLFFLSSMLSLAQGDSGVRPQSSDEKASNAGKPKHTSTKPTANHDLLPDKIEFKGRSGEDMSTPEIPRGMADGVMVLGNSERNGYTRELVRATWRDPDPLDLWIMKPAGVKKPPVILYLYSYPSSNERYNDLDFCRFLTQQGYAAVGFLSALTGDRIQNRPPKQWFVSQLQESLGTSVHDVQLVLNYLADRGDMDMSRVGIWGDGSGASIAIMAAAVDPRIKALDLLNPWGDWPNWLAKSTLVPENERADYLKPEFLSTVENLDPLKWLPQLKTRQVRLQYIKDGVTVTPQGVKERMESVAPPNAQIVHYQNPKEFRTNATATGTEFDWLKKQLLTPATFEAANDGNNKSSGRRGDEF